MNIVEFLTPTNLKQEKEHFFSSSTYNPQFTYAWGRDDIDQWIKKTRRYKSLINAITDQDYDQIITEAKKVFSTDISDAYLKIARDIILHTPSYSNTFGLQELINHFKAILKKFNLNYSIEICDLGGFNVRPQFHTHCILISYDVHLQFFSVDGLVKHEMSHVLRFENGEFNGIKRSSGYLPTEEALASYLQDYRGEYGKVSLFQHAAEYAVTEVGLRGSLRDMVNFLCEIGFDREHAWKRAIRHKYGFMDTSRPGDIMKPSMYFHHEQKVKHLSDGEKLRLMVGKIRLDELSTYSQYAGKIPQKVLCEYYGLEA